MQRLDMFDFLLAPSHPRNVNDHGATAPLGMRTFHKGLWPVCQLQEQAEACLTYHKTSRAAGATGQREI